MPESRPPAPPLASYVLRLRGHPATITYELHDLRTGDRRIFFKAETLATYLRQHGLAEPPVDDETPGR